MELAPIEYMKWPKRVPKPNFDEVRDTALACMGIDPNEGRDVITQRNTAAKWKTARQLVFETAEYLLHMSLIEVATKLGYAGTSAMRDRPTVAPRFFAHTNASVAMVNEVVYCLLRNKLEHVAVERKKQQTVAPFHAADITRASLQGHAGGAA